MSQQTSFRGAVTDIQALLGDADPAIPGLDNATLAWLAHTRQAITAQRRPPGYFCAEEAPRPHGWPRCGPGWWRGSMRTPRNAGRGGRCGRPREPGGGVRQVRPGSRSPEW